MIQDGEGAQQGLKRLMIGFKSLIMLAFDDDENDKMMTLTISMRSPIDWLVMPWAE